MIHVIYEDRHGRVKYLMRRRTNQLPPPPPKKQQTDDFEQNFRRVDIDIQQNAKGIENVNKMVTKRQKSTEKTQKATETQKPRISEMR